MWIFHLRSTEQLRASQYVPCIPFSLSLLQRAETLLLAKPDHETQGLSLQLATIQMKPSLRPQISPLPTMQPCSLFLLAVYLPSLSVLSGTRLRRRINSFNSPGPLLCIQKQTRPRERVQVNASSTSGEEEVGQCRPTEGILPEGSAKPGTRTIKQEHFSQ